jgi:hypothetical protein
MTNVEISYHYGMSPDEAVMRGIDNIREVYGIRRLTFNQQARSVAVEYDATRLNRRPWPVCCAALDWTCNKAALAIAVSTGARLQSR